MGNSAGREGIGRVDQGEVRRRMLEELESAKTRVLGGKTRALVMVEVVEGGSQGKGIRRTVLGSLWLWVRVLRPALREMCEETKEGEMVQ